MAPHFQNSKKCAPTVFLKTPSLFITYVRFLSSKPVAPSPNFLCFAGFVMARGRKKRDLQEGCGPKGEGVVGEAVEPVTKRDAGASVEKAEKGDASVNGIGVSMGSGPRTRGVKRLNYAEFMGEDDGEVLVKKRGRKKSKLAAGENYAVQKNEKIEDNNGLASEQEILGYADKQRILDRPIKKRGRKRKNLSAEKGHGESCSAQQDKRVEESNGFDPGQGIAGDANKGKMLGRPKKKRGRVGVANKVTKEAVLENKKKNNGTERKDSYVRNSRTGYSLRATEVPHQDIAKIIKYEKVPIFFAFLCFCFVVWF